MTSVQEVYSSPGCPAHQILSLSGIRHDKSDRLNKELWNLKDGEIHLYIQGIDTIFLLELNFSSALRSYRISYANIFELGAIVYDGGAIVYLGLLYTCPSLFWFVPSPALRIGLGSYRWFLYSHPSQSTQPQLYIILAPVRHRYLENFLNQLVHRMMMKIPTCSLLKQNDDKTAQLRFITVHVSKSHYIQQLA